MWKSLQFSSLAPNCRICEKHTWLKVRKYNTMSSSLSIALSAEVMSLITSQNTLMTTCFHAFMHSQIQITTNKKIRSHKSVTARENRIRKIDLWPWILIFSPSIMEKKSHVRKYSGFLCENVRFTYYSIRITDLIWNCECVLCSRVVEKDPKGIDLKNDDNCYRFWPIESTLKEEQKLEWEVTDTAQSQPNKYQLVE